MISASSVGPYPAIQETGRGRTRLFGKAALFLAALLLLAWIGRAAAIAPSSPSFTSSTPASLALVDAGLVPMTPASVSASASPAPVVIAAPPIASSHARATPEDPVFINQASADELRRLPGVGEKRAEAIVALRQRVGRFQRVEDLLRVKGVGRATVRKWRPLIRLDATPPSSGSSPDASTGAAARAP